MDSQTVKLQRWLRDQVLRERANGKVTRLELRHLSVGAKQGQEVTIVDLRDAELTDEWFITQTNEFLSAAQSDCEGIGQGTQRYVILVYRKDSPERSSGRFAFLVANEREESEGYESEPPNRAGLTQQLMRHLEAKERVYSSSLTVILGNMQRMASTLSEENARLREQQMQQQTTVEELLSMRHERDLETRKAEARINMLQEAAKEVKLLLPAIVSRFSGAKTGQDNLSTVAVQRFIESLDDEQRTKILETLKPDQQIALLEVIQEQATTPN